MKQIYRVRALHNRKKLSLEEKQAKDKVIFDQLVPFLLDKKCVAIYINKEEEVSTQLLLDWLLANHKKVVVPKVEGTTLLFYEIKTRKDLYLGNFDIWEPKGHNPILLGEVDLWVVPLVGFNKNKQRIGYGKGYYDSVLCQTESLKIGIAYDNQEIGIFPSEKQDIDLDRVITESRHII